MAKKTAKKIHLGGIMSEDDLMEAFLSLVGSEQGKRILKSRHPRQTSFKEKVTYQFKIKLRGVSKPPVWRRVLVPSQFTFKSFHQVIQKAFGWWNEHLYQFGDAPYSQVLRIAEPNPDDWEEPTHDANKFTVGDYFKKGQQKKKLVYTYDFGDDWIHDIVLEEVLPEDRKHASCIGGKGACPDEDCGGPGGYTMMKENGEVDFPNEFDVEDADAMVQGIKDK